MVIKATKYLGGAISGEGVDYDLLAATCRPDLDEKLLWIAETDLNTLNNRSEKLAFLINAYNISVLGLVVKLRAKHRGFLKKGLDSKWWFFQFFFVKKIVVGGKKISLWKLENKLIRKQFNEPKIHFALNCASASCPPLREGLYSAESIDEELELATHNFITAGGVILNREVNELSLSPIFRWYERDFGGREGIIAFIKNYLESDEITWLNENQPKVIWQSYSWASNEN
jgi:hypothetical protein